MKIGYYTHVPFALRANKLYLPHHAADFVNILAERFEVHLLGHADRDADITSYIEVNVVDFTLLDRLSKVRAFLMGGILNWRALRLLSDSDLAYILVRCPTPLNIWIKLLSGKDIFLLFENFTLS